MRNFSLFRFVELGAVFGRFGAAVICLSCLVVNAGATATGRPTVDWVRASGFNGSGASGLLDAQTTFLPLPTTASINFVGLRQFNRVTGTISVLVVANDPAGINKIELFADGAIVGTVTVSPALPVATAYFAWNTSTVVNGRHMLHARSTNTTSSMQSAYCSVFTHNFSASTPTGNSILVNPFIRHQVMGGWEATGQAGHLNSTAWNNYRNALFDQAVNDLGINRIRVEILSGAENPTDYFAQWRSGIITESQYLARAYEIINDNSDPNSMNPNGFKFTQLDSAIDELVLPLRQRLQARGENLWINLNYVDFGSSAFEHKNSPSEYAEFVLATYQHMQTRYGFIPDSWEVILEPDSATAVWSASQVALALKAAGDKLAANGFTPAFTAPSTTNASNTPSYIDQIALTPGAMGYMREFSYHRYCCANDTVLQNIFNRAVLYGKQAGMLEYVSATYIDLHQDIKQGRNSSWQQFTLAGPLSWGPDSGDRYYLVDDSNTSNPTIIMGSRTKFLRQYFKFIRSGAQRIEASSGNSNFDPLAFINSNGKYVVVVKATSNGSFNVMGLPSGTYGIKYTTASQYNVDLSDVTISAGQSVPASIPGSGVITIYAR